MEPTANFDPRQTAKKLLREGRSGALATLMSGSGDPYCSLVNVASTAEGAPLLLLSRLALHTKNILADARVSLMLDERKPGDPLEGARVMLMGNAAPTQEPEARRRFRVRHARSFAQATWWSSESLTSPVMLALEITSGETDDSSDRRCTNWGTRRCGRYPARRHSR